jgi:Flp pilus assembly pilin Flp
MSPIKNLFARLWSDQEGTLLSTEYVILGTILTLGLIVGITAAQNSLVSELEDYAAAIERLWTGSPYGTSPVTFSGDPEERTASP